MSELKRTDIALLRSLDSRGYAARNSWALAVAVKERLLAARLIRWEPGSFRTRVVITKAGREALRAATTEKEKS